MRGRFAVFLAVLLAALPAAAQTPPADTLRELYASLGRCLGEAHGREGSAVTIVFSLRRDGSLIGRPRISYARLPGDSEAQRRFLAGLGAALARCLPVAVTPGLGGAIAGRLLTFRLFIGREASLLPRRLDCERV